MIASCEKSLADLRLSYLDLYLVHWPFPNFHPPGCDVTARSKDSKPYIHANYMKTWAAMEEVVKRGLVRHIGTSNMTIPKLKLVLGDAKIRPAVNEMELHPHFQQPELFDFVRANGMEPIGYSPLGSPHRPERDRTPEDTLRPRIRPFCALPRGMGFIPPLSVSSGPCSAGKRPFHFPRIRETSSSNLAVTGDPLTDEEMSEIDALDRNCRLIKGQVFLWKDGQEWEDLWDVAVKLLRLSLVQSEIIDLLNQGRKRWERQCRRHICRQ